MEQEKTSKSNELKGIDASGVRRALDAILSSSEFASSPRLKEFLRYIIEEQLAGRGRDIKGKTIAVDVYDRDLSGASASDNIVRVEARRLRRLLDEYYENSGKGSTLRIHVDSGGYIPRFETFAPSRTIQAEEVGQETAIASQSERKRLPIKPGLYLAALLAAVLAAGIFVDMFPRSGTSIHTGLQQNASNTDRLALRTKSVRAVQSARLAEQGRGLLFPVFDKKHQLLAIDMFDHAIELDPDLPDGYAGKAQALATLAFLSTDEIVRTEVLANARQIANKALDLQPTNAWAHSAMAWVDSIGGDAETARKHADIALRLAPHDGYLLDFDGAVAVLAGDGARAAEASSPDRKRNGSGPFAQPNIWAVANYMLGNFEEVVRAFEKAPSFGAPVAPPSIVLLAAAHDHLGDGKRARQYIRELQSEWPDFPVRFIIERMFPASPVAQDVLFRLQKNGFEAKTVGQ